MDFLDRIMQAVEEYDPALSDGVPLDEAVSVIITRLRYASQRATDAEDTAARLVEENRELSESVTTLRAELERAQARAKSNGEMWAQADKLYKLATEDWIEANDTIRKLAAALGAEKHRADTLSAARNVIAAERDELRQQYEAQATLGGIVELLDKHAVDCVRGASVIERVDFALRLLDERTDQIINYTTEELADALRIPVIAEIEPQTDPVLGHTFKWPAQEIAQLLGE